MRKQTPSYTSTRIWTQTVKVLRFIHAITGESIVMIMDRLAIIELKRLQDEKGDYASETE